MSSITAISAIDGRYSSKTEPLQAHFSEFALIKQRVRVEVLYFISLSSLNLEGFQPFNEEDIKKIFSIYESFSLENALKIKDIEKVTNHDVKAVEYFIKERLEELKVLDNREFVHFALTSQDINNTAMPLLLKEALEIVMLPKLITLIEVIEAKAEAWKDIAMLARTHGQPASPTKLGKEIKVFYERLINQFMVIRSIPASAKFGGATGNFNAHLVAYPNVDWREFADRFVSGSLGLQRQQTTTQIEHYDDMASLFDAFKRVNNILIDLSRDIWSYVSMDYFKQKIKEGEIGSSAMPHKVNPIDFENAEGNLALANAMFEFLAGKLPISRLQRDLTDSTVTRNIGVPFAHTLIAFDSLFKGLDKLIVNETKIHEDLTNNWVVVAEGIQNILRREGVEKPYEKLKDLTRQHGKITEETFIKFIETLPVKDSVKEELKRITPFNYTGVY